ncbi:hypothetical protein DCAR_0520546 [Daucus carota subsp. sativus]|uniref:WAT1-related protein n=1 Tax=Daucus carota subsp. sativus TaxID=79200 RepID=A0A164YLP3_DAUCS|nr:PREDICTED: WAT1-related protein At4g30420 [Daucus carota subsp. sativus]XP_017250239.1 PREDICTED: WAT1-related protein At4g30420 [Daucus carota subsp. sativus]WOH01165.1 hypothetical protein DCAR_0520546 [Daucus carota subsp. sativus]
MGDYESLKPVVVMILLQFSYAAVALSTRAALLEGMSPRVFVVYRQAIATLVITPLAFFTRSKTSKSGLGLRSFSLIFLASLIGVTLNQNVYFEGLYLASSSMASAMSNLLPAVTFVITLIVGLEKIKIRSLRSIAKIVGTVLCVAGAIAMALLKGPKLLNAELLPNKSVLGSAVDNYWLIGCFLLFASSCCWSFWLILQVPVSASYPDHLSLSAWMCFMATLQSAIVALFVERDLETWKMDSYLQLACCFFSGIVGSGISFYAQAWVISKRGPLFSAMFNPLNTVIVTILASIFLHEEIYTGSVIGAVTVILGLYTVLWGKAKDITGMNTEKHQSTQNVDCKIVSVRIDDSVDKTRCKNDLEEPLLLDKATKVDSVDV